MHLDLIVGMALDYWDDIKYSFEEVFKLYPPELQLGFLKFLKGTPVRYKAEQHGFVYDPNPPYQIIESNYLTRAELHQIEILENALEIYWNKKRTLNALRYVAEKYSIFDFFIGLGSFFVEKKDFHKYALKDVYTIMYDFVKKEYADDLVLHELITIDYYAYSKVKPQILFVEEMPKAEKFKLINALHLNHHKYSFMVFPIHFDFQLFEKEGIIELGDYNMIVQYDGINKPTIVDSLWVDALAVYD
jgi:anaerobic magnesium-protoporphyrin IX monomethyl ester cyclase